MTKQRLTVRDVGIIQKYLEMYKNDINDTAEKDKIDEIIQKLNALSVHTPEND